MSQKGAWPKSRDLLLNFGIPLISLEQLKIQSSNFARGLKVRATKSKNEKFRKIACGLGRMTYMYLSNFGTLLISLEWLRIQTRNFVCTLTVTDTKRKKLKIGETGN